MMILEYLWESLQLGLISDKEKLRLTKVFLEFNESFEDLMQRNIIKDAYIWK